VTVRGPHLEVGPPTAAERDWIFAALCRPEIHLPLSCPRPPSRRTFDAGKLYLVELEGSALHRVDYVTVRRHDGAPRAFFLVFPWGGARLREIDVAAPEGMAPGEMFEANLLLAAHLFGDPAVASLRWRVVVGRRPLRWYRRLGAEVLQELHEVPPRGGAPVRKELWGLERGAYAALLDRAGLTGSDWSAAGDLWRRLGDHAGDHAESGLHIS